MQEGTLTRDERPSTGNIRLCPPALGGEGMIVCAWSTSPLSTVCARLRTHSVCSPPQPNPGLPGFGRFKICRKRASPQPAGEGLGVGVVRFLPRWRDHHFTAPPPPRPPSLRSAADPPHKGEGKIESAAHADSIQALIQS